MIKYSGILLILLFTSGSFSQSVYAPLNSDYYNLIDRIDVKDNSGTVFSSVKPYLRIDIAMLATAVSKDTLIHLSRVDKRNLDYLREDNWEWCRGKDSVKSRKPLLGGLYRKNNAFFAIDNKDFLLQINPVAYFSYGKDMPQSGQTTTTYINTRGFELRGLIDNKIGFYTFLTDNQAAFPEYVNTRINSSGVIPGVSSGVIPGENFWQRFKTNGYDFYTANGYIDFKITKHISTQFGQDKNFMGDGYRSLMLSDFSSNYLFWKVDTKIGRLEYVNLFAQMTADPSSNSGGTLGDVFYPRKYMALHYLNLKVSGKFTLGLFESETFGNTDSLHNRGFDPTYLNPVIFYNAVENGLGAPDKDHIGINWKWNFLHHFSLYGTILLDEFNISELRAGTGWWGNKQAGQLGLKYIDVLGIPNLDIQLEGNAVPPYTYETYSFSKVTNYSYFANYSNYGQPLADPNGANFYEGIGILRYQPFYRFSFTGKLIYTIIGLDPPPGDAPLNYGSNVMLPNTTHVNEYGNYITQGVKTTIMYGSFTASCQLAHNMFIDLTAIIRQENSAGKNQTFNQPVSNTYYNSSENIFSVSFRWNIAQRLQEF